MLKWQENTLPKDQAKEKFIRFLNQNEIAKAKTFHQSFPLYSQTPLVSLPNLAAALGVKNIFVKDESHRFGLNAFKVLGGSFAMAKYLAQKLGQDIAELPHSAIIKPEIRQKLGAITFVTATDGNHGRGVAWTANKLKQKAVVYLPLGSSETRLANILAEGADASITKMNYDDCVRQAAQYAAATGAVVVQDTAWDGYEEIPAWIMQGYGTLAWEAIEQLQENNIDRPTHIFLQAGVGSFAGAVQGFFASIY
ncbi:MAG: diaminopropionate ammonia-lyase, partial [Sporomusaceae bacterium]|nr:diaminopropionate ammonia-lyase [Sporomusaceae bacterium]